jgi:hypothetical protein
VPVLTGGLASAPAGIAGEGRDTARRILGLLSAGSVTGRRAAVQPVAASLLLARQG